MDQMEKLEKLAGIAKVTVKHSRAYSLEGKECLLCGSGFHVIWNPYKNKEQAFDVLFQAGMELRVEADVIVANGEVTAIEEFDKPWHALCHAICEGALK